MDFEADNEHDDGRFSFSEIFEYVRSHKYPAGACGDPIEILRLDQCQQRSHLSRCFEKQELSPFPLTKKQVVVCTPKKLTISLYCYCRMPESFDVEMVACDVCDSWYHVKCVNVSVSDSFVCRYCE